MKRDRKRVLVTGGAGFLGSHPHERLGRDGHDMPRVDNVYTGTRANVARLLDDPNFVLLRHDVTFPRPAGAARAARRYGLRDRRGPSDSSTSRRSCSDAGFVTWASKPASMACWRSRPRP